MRVLNASLLPCLWVLLSIFTLPRQVDGRPQGEEQSRQVTVTSHVSEKDTPASSGREKQPSDRTEQKSTSKDIPKSDLGEGDPLIQKGLSDETAPATQVEDQEDWRFIPFPIVGYNIERGLSGGLFLNLFKKRRTVQTDRGASYSIAFNLVTIFTTKGYQNHRLVLDAPYLTKDRLRFQLTLNFERQKDGWYSGVSTPIALQEELIDDKAYFHTLQSFWILSSLTQPLHWVSPYLSIAIGSTQRFVQTAINEDSLFESERAIGSEGGLFSSLQLSISWDTRDREPDTRNGVWIESSARFAHPWIGSDWDAWGLNTTYRHYASIDSKHRFIYAHRLGIDYQGGHVPYFQQNIMGGTQWTELGGNSTLRGYQFGRFRSDLAIYLSQELRTRIFRFHYKSRPIDWVMTPLFELGWLNGGVPATIDHTADAAWLWGGAGIGGRLIYDQGLVVRIDVIWALERLQRSDRPGVISIPQLGIFAMTGHSF